MATYGILVTPEGTPVKAGRPTYDSTKPSLLVDLNRTPPMTQVFTYTFPDNPQPSAGGTFQRNIKTITHGYGYYPMVQWYGYLANLGSASANRLFDADTFQKNNFQVNTGSDFVGQYIFCTADTNNVYFTYNASDIFGSLPLPQNVTGMAVTIKVYIFANTGLV